MVAPQILVLIVGVRVLLGELKEGYCSCYSNLQFFGPFVYRLGQKILNL